MLLLGVLLRAPLMFGGGFLLVDQGGPYRWDPAKPVRYRLDRGGLDASLDEQKSIDFVRSILQRWEDVPSASIRFEADGLLDVDVTANNASRFLSDTADGISPIIFDRDGSVIELIAGVGSSRNILGFASPRVTNSTTHTILEGDAVINGSLGVSQSILRAVLLHEFGHLIGLDHTQAGVEFTDPLLAGSNYVAGRQFIPIMFPIIYTGGPVNPQDDDILWLANLYPVDLRGTATISGTVRRASGDFFPGANVVLRNADYDPVRGTVHVYSVVSDYLLRSTGEFSFVGIPPGSYQLFIEPLAARFTDGSGVGPFDSRFTGFPRDFYNGARESGDPDQDDPAERVVLNAAPDSKIQNIVVVSNEIPNNLSALADDDAVAYVFPNGFRFSFYGKTYDRVFVNADGNLTFGGGEFTSRARDLKRFVSGPPRIGALFTDLNPEKLGEIVFSQSDRSVTFTWMNIVEYSEKSKLDASDGNQFSITLFANGDVEFRYGRLSLTRADLEEDLAVVGITPGGGAAPQRIRLSASDAYTYGGTSGLAEVFADSIDLAGKRILLRSGAASPLPAQRTLVVPFLQQNSDFFTAIAISNPGNTRARLSLTAYGASGNPLYTAEPALEPATQLAKSMSDLFGVSGSELPVGWVQLKADSAAIGSFFQVGGFDSRWLDGSTASAEAGTRLYLTRVFEGVGTFQGRDAQTWVSLVNPNDVTVRLVLSLYSASGVRRSRVEIKLPAHGVAYDRVSGLFRDVSFPQGDGYISVQAIGGGVVAFELVKTQDTAIGLTAAAPTFATRFYSAQLASGKSADGALFTALNIVNTAGFAITINAQAFSAERQPLGTPFSRQLPAFASAQVTAQDLFGLGDVRTAPVSVGTLQLGSDYGAVAGDVVFGDALANVRFAAGLPLQSELATEALFSHVAQGRLRPGDPASGYFTGLALYNPNSVPAIVILEDFTPQGEVKRSSFVLQPGQRLSRSVVELIPSAALQTGGYMVLRSDVGIVAQELLGNETLDFLSAVPPDLVRKAELR